MTAQDEGSIRRDSGAAGCLMRLLWMAVGPPLVFFAALFVAIRSYPFFSLVDLGFLGGWAILLAARYVDIRYFDGCDTDGEPVARGLWTRFAAVATGVVALAWLAAHGIAWLRS